MISETTSLPSVNSFLNACNKTLPVLRDLNSGDRAYVLLIKNSPHILDGNQVIGCIENLETEAQKLRELQGIVRPFIGTGLPSQFTGGILSAGTRNGRYTPEAILECIRSVFDEYNCRRSRRSASQLKCDNGFYLYNLVQEFLSFEKTAKALNEALYAGQTLFKGSIDQSLERRFKRNLRKVIKFHNSEFTEITVSGPDGLKIMNFVAVKRLVYNYYRPELERLSKNWGVEETEITTNHNLNNHPSILQPRSKEPAMLEWLSSVISRFKSANQELGGKAAKIVQLIDTKKPYLEEFDSSGFPDPSNGSSEEIMETLQTIMQYLNQGD